MNFNWLWLAAGGGAAAIAAALLSRQSTGPMLTNEDVNKEVFRSRLPSRLARWADYLYTAGTTYGVSPWLLAGILERESKGGEALTPKNDPGGTGDFTARTSGHSTFKFANPATGKPPDGKGWGRGLMQIDYGVHNSWVVRNPWWDPQVNIDYAAKILSDNFRFFQQKPGPPITISNSRVFVGTQFTKPWATWGAVPGTYPDPRPLSGSALTEAALAAYNGGAGGVLAAVAAGIPAQAATTGGDYVTWMQTRINQWKGNV